MSADLDLLRDCSEAGIVFHPRAGKLRPSLTLGPITKELRQRVECERVVLVDLFAAAFDWSHDPEVCMYDAVTVGHENGTQRQTGRGGVPTA